MSKAANELRATLLNPPLKTEDEPDLKLANLPADQPQKRATEELPVLFSVTTAKAASRLLSQNIKCHCGVAMCSPPSDA